MKLPPEPFAITIPASVRAVPDLSLAEQTLLTIVAANPLVSNSRLAGTLRMTRSGLKAMLKRLGKRGLITVIRFEGEAGHEIHVNVPIDGGQKVAQNDGSENREKVTPSTGDGAPATGSEAQKARKVATLAKILRDADSNIQRILHSDEGFHSETLAFIWERAAENIRADVPDGPDKTAALARVTACYDAWTVSAFVAEHAPRKYRRKFDHLIAHTTPEQLARLRAGIEQGKLAGTKPTLLLEAFTGVNPKTQTGASDVNAQP
jgi:hypothetical protein